MTTEQGSDLKRFLIRLGVTTAAVLLVLYAAKVWFVDKQESLLPSQSMTSEQVGSPSSERHPGGTAQVISWQDANKHYGEHGTVEGSIVLTHNSGKACFLNFHPDYKRHLTGIIFASAFPRFPAKPENYYYGKRVRVTGHIKEYKGKPEIILNDPSQIEILK